MTKSKKNGFTLAEALVALLVMSLILIAAMPVITRKKRSIERVTHGAFACYWDNGALVGKYLTGQKTSGANTVYDAQEGRQGCYFTPPAGAKNFVVTTVGGGGGGASAGAAAEESKQVYSSPGAGSYKVPFTGTYKMLIVGGGGGGGRADQIFHLLLAENVKRRACTGAKGAMVYISAVNLSKDDNLSIKVGSGGGASTSYTSPGHSGSESYVKNKDGNIAIAYGGGGGCSFSAGFTPAKRAIVGYDSSGSYISAGKGAGSYNLPNNIDNFYNVLNGFYNAGPGEYTIFYENPSHPFGHGKRGELGFGNKNSYHQNDYFDMRPITYLNSFSSEFGIEFNKFERTNRDGVCNGRSAMYGCGNLYNFFGAGGGGEGKPYDYWDFGQAKGGDGIVIIQGKPLYAGLGGYAGEVKQSAFADLPPKTLVFPGKGGKGGYLSPVWDGYGYYPRVVAPAEGEKSYVKNYAKTNGGKPATIVNISDQNTFSAESSNYGVSGGSGEAAGIAPTVKPKGGAGGYSVTAQNGYIDNSTIHGLSRPVFGNNKSIDMFNNLIGAGAGGGGGTSTGAVYTSSETSSSSRMQTFIDNNLGKGGDGTSGVVFIQW